MPKFYATRDADGRDIQRDADISVFATKAEAEAFLREPYTAGNGWDEGSVVIEVGQFGDCWIKSMEAPKVGQSWIAPFSYMQLLIQRPGEHPGGKMYWTTPRPDVLVVSHVREAE
jgi:hypothetical protein